VKIRNFRSKIWNFIKLTRAVFLLGGFLLYALGAVAAVKSGAVFNGSAYLLGQIVVTSSQLMAQYLNEYYDIEADRLAKANRTWFSGGSGILAEGVVSPVAVLAAARICAVIAVLTGILASIQSPWMMPVVLLSLLGSWSYSAPPIQLMSSGWGELTASVIVALLVPMAGYVMQAGFPPGNFWLVCLPLILVHAAMLVSFEFPDHPADKASGKRTLAVRLGLRRAAWVVNALIGCAFLFIIIFALLSKYPGQWMGLAAPVAIWQAFLIHRVIALPTRTNYLILTTGGVGLFVLMAFLACLEFVIAFP
jgi:1,4-dihydroxy-2-naphthoate polyprenyltransferase